MMQYTIASDDEVEVEVDSDVEETKNMARLKGKDKAAARPAFSIDFDTGDLPRRPVVRQSEDSKPAKRAGASSKEDTIKSIARVEQRIARNAKKAATTTATAGQESDEDTDSDSDASSAQGMAEEDEQAFFDTVVDSSGNRTGDEKTFAQLNLSRPFLRAVEGMGFTHPTPIQAQVIPYALAGRDICASAVTGSGKTAAFVLPCLERLLFRPKDRACTRILVVTPTRELADQIHEVLVKLAQHTDITCCLICGGKKDVRAQEVVLRQGPDFVICTPGRMLDHLRNSRAVSLNDLDVLVLDEVDRLLDLGFQAEVEELVRHCPRSRQTLLFSATMTPKVEDLIKLSLQRPVRVKVDGKASTVAPRLVQDFVKVRDEEDVEALLTSLVNREFGQRTIVFFELKRLAHRFCAILNLLGHKAAELHGDLPQAQRFLALHKFRDGEVDILVATDVAARGLDIQGVRTVINAEMPRSVSTYVHRVGRTARAGKAGRSITLVTDARRKVLKEVLKAEAARGSEGEGGAQVLSRTISASVVAHFTAQIAKIEGDIANFLREEYQKNKLEALEREAERAENLLMHSDEIKSRPQRTWFQTAQQKEKVREAVRVRDWGTSGGDSVEDSAAGAASAGGRKKKGAEPEEAETEGEGEVHLEADRQARQLAAMDDYREETGDKPMKHRQSRKKRRRDEALKAVAEAEAEEGERNSRLAPSAPKRAKIAAREKEEKKKDRALTDATMKKVWVVNEVPGGGLGDSEDAKAMAPKKRLKVVRQKFAAGGLDMDEADWAGAGDSRRWNKKAMPEPEFKDFDPTKHLRKGGKKGHQAFKSKGRYKRR